MYIYHQFLAMMTYILFDFFLIITKNIFATPQKYAYSAYQQCYIFCLIDCELLDFKTFPNTTFNSNLFNIIKIIIILKKL